ncbi:hypothetical protein Dsin_009432 [Dipteronia sinensis]|uniref:Sulfotransferase n=1 Tax=Dipteronia sinensis TaxID=43782 RepID=A0AAE0AQY1_9ROSI|nr:hypothetical protein Dsin_009432 [Dipteronia sinensis]
MAEYIYIVNKDTLIVKPPKKSPMFLRMIALLFAMVCGVLICSIRLKQLSTSSKINFRNIRVIQIPDIDYGIKQIEIPHDNGTKQSEIPPVNYPKPQTFSRAECAHNPVQFFAIISMQRSGSGWFETLLNSHSNVSSNGEIFSVFDRRKNISSIINTLDKVYNLDWFTSASKNECSAAVGLKWMLNQGLMEYHEEIVEYFNRRGVSAIFLFRRNLLRRLVSVLANSYDRYAKLLNGTHKAHVHSHTEAETLSSYKPVINSTSLISDLKEVEVTANKALKYFNSTRHIILYYEDLVMNRTKLNDVLDFLRLPQMELRSRQVKIHTGSLSEHIKNWDDINRTLNRTVYESFLRD